jgi:hypothetical protein
MPCRRKRGVVPPLPVVVQAALLVADVWVMGLEGARGQHRLQARRHRRRRRFVGRDDDPGTAGGKQGEHEQKAQHG